MPRLTAVVALGHAAVRAHQKRLAGAVDRRNGRRLALRVGRRDDGVERAAAVAAVEHARARREADRDHMLAGRVDGE